MFTYILTHRIKLLKHKLNFININTNKITFVYDDRKITFIENNVLTNQYYSLIFRKDGIF